MDDIVKQALAKWPNVPHCYGWLGLDARGNWYLRDDPTQAPGPFPTAKGSMLRHEKLIDFIQRNYEHDAQGQWFFQNGPQRVYVELEAAPWVWRVDEDLRVKSHTGQAVEPTRLPARRGGQALPGRADRARAGPYAGHGHGRRSRRAGAVGAREVRAGDLPARFGYVLSPAAPAGQARRPH